MGVGVLIFNEGNELLIVKPSYKDCWSIPGGVVEANESPRQACIRETKEEVGLELKNPRFLAVDYYANYDAPEKGEALQFMFYGGVVNSQEVSMLKPAVVEINEIRFVKIDSALPLLSEKLQKRVVTCIKALTDSAAAYLENGKSPDGKVPQGVS